MRRASAALAMKSAAWLAMLVKSCRSFSPKALGFCESTIITPSSSPLWSSGTAIELRMPS
jgi:hypothetical protein